MLDLLVDIFGIIVGNGKIKEKNEEDERVCEKM